MIEVRPPGDKSISHRALLFAAVAGGLSRIRGLGDGEDVRSTARVVQGLGVDVELVDGPHGLDARIDPGDGPATPTHVLDCGNSGTTARLMAGLIVGLGLSARLDGDESLRARPMRRIVYPLQAMGARIEYLGAPDRLPFAISRRATGSLRTLKHRPRVASAQVKSAILMAGVLDGVAVEIREPGLSRDHTERLLAALGAPVRAEGPVVLFEPDGWDGRLDAIELDVPGDPSSAAFVTGAALLTGRPVGIRHVSGNPTRTGFLEVLRTMGADIERSHVATRCGEPVEDWVVRPPARLDPFDVGGDDIPALIDELPLLAALAARADGQSRIRNADELRVKESDRIRGLAENFTEIGVAATETEDGLVIEGGTAGLSGRVDPRGDHRIAMAFGVLGTAPDTDLRHADPDCAAVSYPRFWADLESFLE
ncbi:MAG: 3-phosphoshikimate 1-carboxyvinyltransferase [Gemmatimonadota bacterium]|nr:3-phosphoshikimate 1-carboxyvinyltransferase [Gemmatimonadota bacterium]